MNLAFIQGIGPLELVIVLVIVLLFVGPKRLPALGRSVGTGMRELRESFARKADGDEVPSSASESKPATAVLAPPPAPAEPAEPAQPASRAVDERS